MGVNTPVSMARTVVSGWIDSQPAQVVTVIWINSSLMPLSAKGPTAGSPKNWCHKVFVPRSYISLLLR